MQLKSQTQHSCPRPGISVPRAALSTLLMTTTLVTVALTGCLRQESAGPDSQAESPATAALPQDPRDSLDETQLPGEAQVEEILKARGYSDIVFQGKTVTVEGDIVMHRADFLDQIPDGPAQAGALAKTAQRFFSGRRVDRTKAYRVYISPSVPRAWADAMQYAIWSWVGMTHLNIIRTYTYDNRITCQVTMGNLNPGIYAMANYPFPLLKKDAALQGNSIRINQAYANLDLGMAFKVAVHEMGHTLGFTHSDSKDGNWIYGTPMNDPHSILNTVVDTHNVITWNDRFAARLMYPR
jgi:hypothetical protein